jgi:transposase
MIVGIDVSKQSFDIAWVIEGQGHHRQFEYSGEGIEALLEQTPQDAHYVMEATGIYHTRLALRLYQSGRRVSVVNPLVIKRFAQMQLSRVKSDKADAQLIRCYGEQHELSIWSPASPEILELQQAHGWLDDLIRERARLQNRQEAQAHQARASAFVVKQMSTQLRHLDKQIKACEQHLEGVVKKSFAELYARLRSIPSIGPKTAIELIVVTGGFSRFDDVKALCAYVGVSPTTFQSGTSVNGKGTIAKMGQGRMRQLLYLCSWTARRCNPACRTLYTRLETIGKPPKVISIAIAHKLLRQAFAVATKGVPYSETYA